MLFSALLVCAYLPYRTPLKKMPISELIVNANFGILGVCQALESPTVYVYVYTAHCIMRPTLESAELAPSQCNNNNIIITKYRNTIDIQLFILCYLWDCPQ